MGRLGSRVIAVGVLSATAALALWTVVFVAATFVVPSAPPVLPIAVGRAAPSESSLTIEPTAGVIWCVQPSPHDPNAPSSPDLCPDFPGRPPQTAPTRLHVPMIATNQSLGAAPPQLTTEVIGPPRRPDLRC
ncbi:MAG: hypothetical protein NZ518_07850, partial [Dehalococcoidia bacterium]|nr:hypothetical protein [Dehalococcoidia bacterium]